MPVSRNLSLPSSIEAGKLKKRPVELHNLKHCMSFPTPSQNLNNSNNNDDCDVDKDAGQIVDDTAHGAPLLPFPGPSSPMGRVSLSHPCLSESNKAGATSIFPHLFLGSQKDAADEVMLAENKIQNVLNVSCACARPKHLDDDHFHRIAVRDNYLEKITPYLDDAVQFIEAARLKNERVLVHCLAGVSRSATVAIAYVMYYLRLCSDDAYSFVKDRRPTISPNFNFLGQLMDYEKQLRGSGHMNRPRIGPVPAHVIHDAHASQDALESGESASSSGGVTKPVVKLQRSTLVKPRVSSPSVVPPPSSFCRRRNGPVFGNLARNNAVACQFGDRIVNGGAGVTLELHVQNSNTEQQGSRELGSAGKDGKESDDDSVDPDHSSADSSPGDELFQYSSCLPTSYSVDNPCRSRKNALLTVNINLDTFEELNTGSGPDVEMVDADQHKMRMDVTPPSPPSPPSFHISSFDRSAAPSPKSDRLSRKTRSPKIVRKSWRPPYDYSSRAGKLSVVTSQSQLCASPSVAISSLTLSSPALGKLKDPIDSALSGSGATTLQSDASATDSELSAPNFKVGTKAPFRLISSSEIKPKWRNRKNSGTESGSVLSRQNSNNNINIVTCS